MWAYRVPGGQGVGLQGPGGPRGRPTGFQGVKGRPADSQRVKGWAYRIPGGQQGGLMGLLIMLKAYMPIYKGALQKLLSGFSVNGVGGREGGTPLTEKIR